MHKIKSTSFRGFPGGSVLCDHLEEWDKEGGRETQEGGDMWIYVYE